MLLLFCESVALDFHKLIEQHQRLLWRLRTLKLFSGTSTVPFLATQSTRYIVGSESLSALHFLLLLLKVAWRCTFYKHGGYENNLTRTYSSPLNSSLAGLHHPDTCTHAVSIFVAQQIATTVLLCLLVSATGCAADSGGLGGGGGAPEMIQHHIL